ncbi:MAG: quinone oxidoreductase [Bryobacteraceae bacterium]
MKAVFVEQPGGVEALRYADQPKPVPGDGQALIKVSASGVNFIDVYFRTGLYKAPLPTILGMEGAGMVESIGTSVTSCKPGDRVAWAMARGSYAEYAVVPAWQLVQIPDGVDYETASASMLQGMTAHYLTHSTFPLTKAHTALVHAAAGGTGLLVVQMAKKLGARVIGTVSTEEKAAQARAAGADHVILYTQKDFIAETKAYAGAVDVVYDSVGATTFQKSLEVLKPRGMMVSFGQSSGPVAAIEPLLLNQKGSLFLTRPSLGAYASTRDEVEERAGDVLRWLADGSLNVHIGGRYPLADAGRAQSDLESRKTTGKLLLTL